MPAALDVRPPSVSTTGFADGLGRRSIRFDREAGATLECLHVRPELAVFERALRQQSSLIDGLDDERLVRVRGFDLHEGRLDVVSELLAGDRLSDIIEARASGDSAVSGMDAAFGFLLQILPTLSTLHAASLVHGAIAPGRIILTTGSQVVLADAIYGTALPRLNLSRRRLWAELGIAAPPAAGSVRMDASADVSQAVLSALMLALGRSVEAIDPVTALPVLIAEAAEIAQIRGGESLAASVRRFFAGALPVSARRPDLTAEQALADVRTIANGELGEDTCLAALGEFARYDAPEPVVVAPARAAVRHLSLVPPAIPVVPEPEAIAPEPAVAVEAPPPVAGQISFVGTEERDLTSDAGVAEPWIEAEIIEAPTWEPAPVVEDVVVPAPLPEPVIPPPSMPEPVVVPEPIAAVEPVYTPPPAPAPAPLPVAIAEPAAPVFTPPPAPVFTPAPVSSPPPQPAFAVPQPVFTPPRAPEAPVAMIAPIAAAVAVPESAPIRLKPATIPVRQAAPQAAASQPALRIKADPPSGYAPAPRMPRGAYVPDVQVAAPAGPFPWKVVAAAIVVLTVGGLGARAYLQRPDQPFVRKASPTAAAPKPVAVPAPVATTGVLVIQSEPAGAHVLLDGTDAGQTPLRLDAVDTGRHTLTLITQTATVKRTVRVEAGKTTSLDVPLFSGWVAVFAPIVLDVSEGHRSLGTTEQGRILLSPGRHTLTLSHRAFGYSSVQTVEVGAGEETTLNITPTGTVSVNAQPWAEVWVDGARVGETPLANLEVALGTREFVFKHPQHGERRTTVTVTTKPSTVSMDLTKSGFLP